MVQPPEPPMPSQKEVAAGAPEQVSKRALTALDILRTVKQDPAQAPELLKTFGSGDSKAGINEAIQEGMKVRSALLAQSPEDTGPTYGELLQSRTQELTQALPADADVAAKTKAAEQAAREIEQRMKADPKVTQAFGSEVFDFDPISTMAIPLRDVSTPPAAGPDGGAGADASKADQGPDNGGNAKEGQPGAGQQGQEAQPGQADTPTQRAQSITDAENHKPPLTPAQILELTARGKDGFQELRSSERAGVVSKLYAALEQSGMQKDPLYTNMLDAVKSRVGYADQVAELLQKYRDPNGAEYKQAIAELDKVVAVAAATEFIGTESGKQYAGEDGPFAKAWKEVQTANKDGADPSLQQEAQNTADAIRKDPNSKESQEAVKKLWQRYKESKAGQYLPSSKKEILEFVLLLLAMYFLPTIPLATAGIIFSKVSENALEDFAAMRGAARNKEMPAKATDPTGGLPGENVATAQAPAAETQPAAAPAQAGEPASQAAASATGAQEAQPATPAQAPKAPEPPTPARPTAPARPASGGGTPPTTPPAQ